MKYRFRDDEFDTFGEWVEEMLYNTKTKRFLEWIVDVFWMPSYLIWTRANNGPSSLSGFHALRKLKSTPNFFRLEHSEIQFIEQYRLRMTAYKDSGQFKNLQDVETLLSESDQSLEDLTFKYVFVSEIISNNCVIAKDMDDTLIALHVTHKGKMQEIPMSKLYNSTVKGLKLWLTSDIFSKNRIAILSQCRMEPHEWYISIFAHKFIGEDNPIPKYYLDFHSKFFEWEDRMAELERERFLKKLHARRNEEQLVKT